jgi:hypothetical protein
MFATPSTCGNRADEPVATVFGRCRTYVARRRLHSHHDHAVRQETPCTGSTACPPPPCFPYTMLSLSHPFLLAALTDDTPARRGYDRCHECPQVAALAPAHDSPMPILCRFWRRRLGGNLDVLREPGLLLAYHWNTPPNAPRCQQRAGSRSRCYMTFKLFYLLKSGVAHNTYRIRYPRWMTALAASSLVPVCTASEVGTHL